MCRRIFGLICVQVVLLIFCKAATAQTNATGFAAFIIKKNEAFKNDSFIPVEEKNSEYWRDIGMAELKKSLQKTKLNLKRAKNVIFFLGDGMSASTVTAARILQGQKNKEKGGKGLLSFEKFPYTGSSKTYCTNAQVADSACSATAYLGGVKANMFTLGVNANVKFNNCSASMDPNNHVSSILAWAQRAGRSTGFITTTSLTHATPAGTYAHVSNRLHESDADVKNFGIDPTECTDIAQQLIMEETGSNFDIIMGGGMSKFLPQNMTDLHGNKGERLDGVNLLEKWQAKHPEGAIVRNRDELLSLDLGKTKQIMGIFNSKLMDYRLKAKPQQPSLTEMTEKAIQLMSRNRNGYFLFVEGGLIDKAHHETKAAIALDETLEMAIAIERARNLTSEKDTLIVTTADHSHALTLPGYPGRGSDILGLNHEDFESSDQKHFNLNYAVGPKQYLNANGTRLNMEQQKIDEDFQYPSYIHAFLGSHAGEDVGIYASGPHAHLFSGVIEQSSIPYIMGYAACVGDGITFCRNRTQTISRVPQSLKRKLKRFFNL